jgi:membrane-associated phospholipid phosphatase
VTVEKHREVEVGEAQRNGHRLGSVSMRNPMADPLRKALSTKVQELHAIDEYLYETIVGLRNPVMDGPIEWISNAANGAKLWIAVAGVLAVGGGPEGRKAAARGIIALSGASLVANFAVKPTVSRGRPTRGGVADRNKVRMPTSSSFPSGHTATAFGFAAAVAGDYPVLCTPLFGAAALVGYSRIHAGVHYPADVAGGGLLGYVVGTLLRRIMLRSGPMCLREDPRLPSP